MKSTMVRVPVDLVPLITKLKAEYKAEFRAKLKAAEASVGKDAAKEVEHLIEARKKSGDTSVIAA